MGAKTCMLVYADGNVADVLKTYPPVDREASSALVSRLFPSDKFEPLEDGCLLFTSPPRDEIRVGCFPGVSIIAADEVAEDAPMQLAPNFLGEGAGKTIYLHVMHSVVEAMAFAVWKDGQLTRSLYLSLEGEVVEEFGPRLPFEEPYWAGERPVDEESAEYPFPFYVMEMGESALLAFFGYQEEGTRYEETPLFDPEKIPLLRFKRVKEKPWWKFW